MERQERRLSQLSSWVVGSALALVGLSIAHSLEDFAHNVPQQFGLSIIQGAVVLGGAYLIHVMLILLAAAEQREGYIGNAIFGVLWLVTAAATHLDDVLLAWPYRAGLLSTVLVIGVMVAGLAVMVAGISAWRATRQDRREERRAIA